MRNGKFSTGLRTLNTHQICRWQHSTMTTVAEVIEIWERLSASSLTGERHRAFVERDQIAELGSLSRLVVRRSAIRARAAHPNGHLLLTDWCEYAQKIMADLAAEEAARIGSRRRENAKKRGAARAASRQAAIEAADETKAQNYRPR
jgi:hypothetical protein